MHLNPDTLLRNFIRLRVILMMAEHNADSTSDDLPPPYNYSLPREGDHSPPAVIQGATVSVSNQQIRQPDHTQASDSDRQAEHPNRCKGHHEDRQNPEGNSESTNNVYTMGTENASNSFSGFIDILYEKKTQPSSLMNCIAYKLGLMVYFCAHLMYPIIIVAIQREHFIYYSIYMFIASAGFACEVIKTLLTLQKCLISSSNVKEDTTQYLLSQAENLRAHEQVQAYYQKLKRVFINYVMSSLGELLIYPILICIMYGFINERAWKFDNGISGYTFLMFVYSVLMYVLYTKFYAVLFVLRVLRFTYVKYDELVHPTEVEWNRYFTPVYLSIPFTIVTALTNCVMTAIIAVTIYVDNITTEDENTNSSTTVTGDYKITPITGIMIAFSIYLPIMSWITYIITNKPWFYKVFSAIYQIGTGRADRMPDETTWNYKLFACIKDPCAYVAAAFLMVPFIAFIVATYLPDYDGLDYEEELGAKDTIQKLRYCFIALFLLANIQAAIMFVTTAIVLFGLTVRCCCKYIRTTNEFIKLKEMRTYHKYH